MGKWGSGKIEKRCLKCNETFMARHDRPGKFCSKSCGSSFAPKRYMRVKKPCPICGKEHEVKRYRENDNTFCSHECSVEWRARNMKGDKHFNWNGGISERPYGNRIGIKERRKKIKFCEECGSNHKLQGHHIIPYAERPDLCNEIENIIILCVNCHAKKHPEIAHLILKGGNYAKQERKQEMDTKN